MPADISERPQRVERFTVRARRVLRRRREGQPVGFSVIARNDDERIVVERQLFHVGDDATDFRVLVRDAAVALRHTVMKSDALGGYFR